MIMDTTAIIDLLRGNRAMLIKIEELQQKNIPLFLTSISVFEIWQGTIDLHHEKKRLQINQLLDSLGMFIFDIPAAKEAGSIHASLKKEGHMIDPEDSMIAGIAKINNEIILTRNVKHFERITHVKVESY